MTEADAVGRDVGILAEAIARASSVLFITGAGMSADSGLPTYRGVGGLYDDADTEDGVAIEDALSGPMFRTRPELTWKYIHQIENACRGARPNRAHEVMAELERTLPRVCVLTQNVDGLHRRAGSANLIEIHGNVHDLACTRCEHRQRVEDYDGLAIPPKCPRCSAIVRPEVVLFGEMLPGPAISALERELGLGFDIVVSVGTTSVFPYIQQPVILAKTRGKLTAEVNPGDTVLSRVVDLKLRAGAAAVFDALAACVTASRSTRSS